DVDPRKLDLGRAAGASHTLDNRRVSLHEALRELTEGEGPDVVIEAVGLPETFLVAVQEVAFTGRVVYIGYAKAPVAYDTAQVVKKELDILGSRNATPQDSQAVIGLRGSGAFLSESAVTRVVALEEAAAALRAWSEDPASVTRIHVNLFCPCETARIAAGTLRSST